MIEVVSIHAPARGATATLRSSMYWLAFQSTRPRGARLQQRGGVGHIKSFNPRAREGRDRSRPVPKAGKTRFNPRAREGRDILDIRSDISLPGFNPRAREGRDAG